MEKELSIPRFSELVKTYERMNTQSSFTDADVPPPSTEEAPVKKMPKVSISDLIKQGMGEYQKKSDEMEPQNYQRKFVKVA